MNFLIFKLQGDFAHFKRHYTTTSPLSFDFPPRTVLSGLVGAILGLSKYPQDTNYYLKFFKKQDAHFGVKINTPIVKKTLPINYLKTSATKGFRGFLGRKQIRVDLVKNPNYTIFFSHTNLEIYQKLKENLIQKHTVYTPCLGSSEYLADLEWVQEVQNASLKQNNQNFIEVHSVIPRKMLVDNQIQFEDKEYMKITLPNEMVENRIVTEYIEVFYEKNGKTIKCIPKNYFTINNENIVLL